MTERTNNSVSLPRALWAEVDRSATEAGVSRSAWFEAAARFFLDSGAVATLEEPSFVEDREVRVREVLATYEQIGGTERGSINH